MKHRVRWYGVLAIAAGLAVLAGCAPASWGEGVGSDPYVRKAAAEGEIQATGQARIQQIAEATLAAAVDQGKTENEQERLMLPLRASETAIAISNIQAQATSVAAQATSTASALQSTAINQAAQALATQRVDDFNMAKQQWELDRAKANARIYDGLIPIAFGLGMFGGILILIVCLWKGADLLLTVLDRRMMVKVTEYGVMVYVPNENNEWSWKPAAAIREQSYYRKRPNLNEPVPAHTFEQITPSVFRSPIIRSQRDISFLALTLVMDSIEVMGEDATTIASLERLKEAGKRWNGDARNEAVRSLEGADAVWTVNGGGTYVDKKYANLANLAAQIRGKHLKIYPPTLPTAGD